MFHNADPVVQVVLVGLLGASVVTWTVLLAKGVSFLAVREAEPAAKAVVTKGSPSIVTAGLAHLVKIIAEADRGDFDASLESLRQAVAERDRAAQNGSRRVELPIDEVVEICDAYYQRLIENAQYDNARKALTILLGSTQRPELKAFVSSRLRRLDLVGKPAPAIRGTDLDHKPFDLADARGKSSSSSSGRAGASPVAAEIETLQDVDEAYRARGLQIVGINLDALSEEGQKPESALSNVRHFLLDYNVRWPTLINGRGDKDFAKAYGVAEIPANVLIDRAGTVVQIDLVSKNLDSMIARAVGR